MLTVRRYTFPIQFRKHSQPIHSHSEVCKNDENSKTYTYISTKFLSVYHCLATSRAYSDLCLCSSWTFGLYVGRTYWGGFRVISSLPALCTHLEQEKLPLYTARRRLLEVGAKGHCFGCIFKCRSFVVDCGTRLSLFSVNIYSIILLDNY